MLAMSSDPNNTINRVRQRFYDANKAMGGTGNKSQKARERNHALTALKEVAYAMRGRKYTPQRSVLYHFQTRARGVPCGVVIDDLDDDGCNFYLTDLDGYPAQWLEDKLDYHDRCRIMQKCYDFYRYRRQLRERGIVHDD